MALRPKQITSFLASVFAARERKPILIFGSPGLGKTDCVKQAIKKAGFNSHILHPVTDDPTDYKGLPHASSNNGTPRADFIPIGTMREILSATEPTVVVFDDFGQADDTVKKAVSHIILARHLNGLIVPDCVNFVLITNKSTDRSGSTPMLEMIKLRFATMLEILPHVDDWSEWAYSNNQRPELIAFLRNFPALLWDFKPTADLTNSPCPRSWSHISYLMDLNLSKDLELPAYSGAVGQAAAQQFLNYLGIIREMPSIDAILMDPESVPVPTSIGILFAVTSGLIYQVNSNNFARVARFAERVHESGRADIATNLALACTRKDKSLQQTQAFVRLMSSPLGQLMRGDSSAA